MATNNEVATTDPKLPANAAASVPAFQVPHIPSRFDKEGDEFTSALFLPRLSLEGSSGKMAKKNKIKAGHYAFITGREEFQDMGSEVNVLVLAKRTKALDLSDPKNILQSFDKDSELFKSIRLKAAEKTENKKGYMYGLEFLVYVPAVKTDQKFGTLFMGNPTARVAARNLIPLLAPKSNHQATLKSEVIDNGTYIWEGPVILPCSTRLPNYPDQEAMVMQMELFLNPIESQIPESVDDEEDAATSRDR